MVEIIFEPHSTTFDNENHVLSGWNDVGLSDLGKSQSVELGERHKNENFEVIFCSDLQRSYIAAEIAFADRKVNIIKDSRLRECNYGDLTGQLSLEAEPKKVNHISVPFPNGESYEQTTERVGNFLRDLLKNYDGKKVIIIGHRATQYGLEYWIKGVPIEKIVSAPWKWQPGWTYILDEID